MLPDASLCTGRAGAAVSLALVEWHLWVTAWHIVSVIAWMAGILYLPRLYVYHADAEAGSVQSEVFKVMERRLLRVILNPAMVSAWASGLLLVCTPDVVNWGQGWPWAKGALVILMSVANGLLARWRRDFAGDCNMRPARFYRLVNEVPTVLLVAIVVLVVVKPF